MSEYKTSNDLVKHCKSETLDQDSKDMLNSGGEWLGAARNWMQWECRNGDEVEWGSDDQLEMKPMTVKDLERFAATIAAATLSEFKKQLSYRRRTCRHEGLSKKRERELAFT